MSRVCIVTPGALGSNPRVVKEAESLSHAGYDVDVISTRTLEIVDRRDDEVLKVASWRSTRLNLRNRTRWQLLRLTQIASARCYALSNLSRLAEQGVSAFAQPLVAAAGRIKADLYIAHYPTALPAVARAAHHHGALYAFDAEDFHLGDLPEGPAYEAERRMIRVIEGRYLPGAAYVTAASPGIADAYLEAYGIARPSVLLNVFPISQAPQGPSPRGTVMPGSSVYWFSQTIGPNRGLECAVRAIGHSASKPHLYLRGTPADGFLERLRAIAADSGVADRLHILPPAAPSEMECLAAAYDVGFVGETGHTPNRRIALTNKQFTYLLAGIPVVMSDIPAHCALMESLAPASRLYRVDDACALAKALDSLMQNSSVLARARSAAFELGRTRFNWEWEQNVLVDQVQRVLKVRRSPACADPVKPQSDLDAL